MSEALLKAAAVLVPEGVDLSKIPDKDREKKEFLELVEGYLNNKINSLQKARLEYLADHMEEVYQREIQREEKAKARAIAEEKRKKREKEHKMLRRKTKKGQPVLRNLAKIQLEQVKRMMEKEKNELNN